MNDQGLRGKRLNFIFLILVGAGILSAVWTPPTRAGNLVVASDMEPWEFRPTGYIEYHLGFIDIKSDEPVFTVERMSAPRPDSLRLHYSGTSTPNPFARPAILMGQRLRVDDEDLKIPVFDGIGSTGGGDPGEFITATSAGGVFVFLMTEKTWDHMHPPRARGHRRFRPVFITRALRKNMGHLEQALREQSGNTIVIGLMWLPALERFGVVDERFLRMDGLRWYSLSAEPSPEERLIQRISPDLREDFSETMTVDDQIDEIMRVLKPRFTPEITETRGKANAPQLRKTLLAMHGYILAFTKPDGSLPLLGDSYRQSALPVLRRGHKLFGNETWAYVASRGRNGTPPEKLNTSLANSPHYMMRNAWVDPDGVYLHVKGTTLGRPGMDGFNLELYAYGKTLISTPGAYSYHSRWRSFFMATRNQNTVTVGGENQERGSVAEVSAFEKQRDTAILTEPWSPMGM